MNTCCPWPLCRSPLGRRRRRVHQSAQIDRLGCLSAPSPAMVYVAAFCPLLSMSLLPFQTEREIGCGAGDGGYSCALSDAAQGNSMILARRLTVSCSTCLASLLRHKSLAELTQPSPCHWRSTRACYAAHPSVRPAGRPKSSASLPTFFPQFVASFRCFDCSSGESAAPVALLGCFAGGPPGLDVS